jgi:hypothetical protein
MSDSGGVCNNSPHDGPGPAPAPDEQWVIWNGMSGILAMATLGQVEHSASGPMAWMASPFEMLGPFSLDELKTQGRITFAACMVMSRLKWQQDQVQLRQEAFEKRRAAQQRQHEAHARFNEGRRRHRTSQPSRYTEQQHREALNLPADGQLQPAQIKTAFRRLAQKAHPDMGGSHEQFVRITEARNALLEQAS